MGTETLQPPADLAATREATAQDAAPRPGVSVRPVALTELSGPLAGTRAAADGAGLPLDVLLDVEVPIVVELGHAEMPLQDLLALKPGAVVELDRLAGEPADLVIRGHVIAQGEIIVVDDNFGLSITNIVDPTERVRHLRQ
jgi:flagellar motor switch protein FliN/FliY